MQIGDESADNEEKVEVVGFHGLHRSRRNLSELTLTTFCQLLSCATSFSKSELTTPSYYWLRWILALFTSLLYRGAASTQFSERSPISMNPAPEFNEPDVQLLRFLAPHLQRAFDLHFRLSDLKTHSDGLEAVMNRLVKPIFVLDAKGKIVFMNTSATALLAEQDGLQALSGLLCAERSAESELLLNAIRRAGTSFAGDQDLAADTLFVSSRSRPAVQLFIAPIRDASRRDSRCAAVVAFVSDPLRTQRPSVAVLHKRFGLTPCC
jgi:PAS domain-containing protein